MTDKEDRAAAEAKAKEEAAAKKAADDAAAAEKKAAEQAKKDAAEIMAWKQTAVGKYVDEHLTVLQDRTGGRHQKL